ncbi:MAG: tail fiber domain-containing protein [Phycisphaerae bacterium]|nr:tail fiber domain-containing protein [Phycisphaerae bacterium]MCZ2398268.1 tail fiber domain-containing protein [Phycisphaerae bacterium]NUQ48828.1 tail fiber domain-containing protein [Phycisphaerae bacterium]
MHARLRTTVLVHAMLVLFALPALAQTPVGTAFTYQAQLVEAGAPANGSYDLQFVLFDAGVGGAQVGPTYCHDNVDIVDGQFTGTLDFGAQFDGDARWLEVRVRQDAINGNCFGGPYTTLAPRQRLTAVPYALHALSSSQWRNSGTAIVNNGTGFVGINRDYTVGLEWFGVHAPVNSGYGGMYVTTEGANAWPFYGYRAGGQAAWTYLDGATGDWHLNVDGNRMTATDEGNIGIGTTTPTHKLHVVSNNTARAVFGSQTAGSGTTYGGYFTSASPSGSGVYGSGPNVGVEGSASGSGGIGVFGTGPSRAVFGTSPTVAAEFIGTGNDSGGVYGVSSGTGGFTYGVFGEVTNANSAGIGVRGRAPSYGVQGEATGNGVGVVGRASTGIGVYGESNVTSGAGVLGANTAASGAAIGVHGVANSPGGYAGYFNGRGYFSGNVGIGTLNPANPLSVAGDADLSGRVSIGVTGADARLLVRGTTGEDAFRVRVEGGTKLLVKDNGGVGIGSNFAALPANGLRTIGAVGIGADPGAFTLVCNGDAAKPGGGSWANFSDARLKRDIAPIAPGMLDRLLSLHGRTFEYVEDAIRDRLGLPGQQTGLIAQEVEQVFPEWIGRDDEGYLYVTERGLTAIVVEALRELRAEKHAEIEALRAAADELEQRLARIEARLARSVAGGATPD